MAKRKTINALFFTNDTASHVWRIDGLARFANQNTPHSFFVTSWQNWNGNIIGANLVIVEQITSPEMIRQCKSQGAKVIYEADDAILDTYGEERKNFAHLEGNLRERALETISLCDAVTVTTPTLKENMARFTQKPIFVIPNYIDYEYYGRNVFHPKRVTDEVRLGWFGGKGHFEDLRFVVPEIKEALEECPNLKFIYCGFGGMSSDSLATEASWGEDVFREIPRERREFVVGVPDDVWPLKHRYLDLDIGICPLVDDYVNRCKTPIKWMEFGILGTPAICSETLYGDYVRDGVDGFIVKASGDWKEKIKMLYLDADLRKSIGNSARRRMFTEFDLRDHYREILSIYKGVLD